MFKIGDRVTPLQALERIIKNVQAYTNIDIEQELDTIAEALHVPSADEVCEAILNDIDFGGYFKDGVFYFFDGSEMVKLNDKGGLQFHCYPNPRTVSLIARFYEGVK